MRIVGAVLLILSFVATGTTACDVHLERTSIAVQSLGFWRGMHLGSGAAADLGADIDWCGTTGTPAHHAVETTLRATVPFAGAPNVASAALQYVWYFREQTSWFAAGYREHHWGDGTPRWTGEAFAETARKVTIESAGLSVWPHAELGRDLQRFDATYARAGIRHIAGYRQIAADLDITVSGSNYASRTFAFHAFEGQLWADWTLKEHGTSSIGAGGGWVNTARRIGKYHTWVGVRVQIR
jgi:hypothetical protein